MTTATLSPTASQATLSHAKVSPFRCRLVADLIRGKTLEDASRLLILEKKKAAKILYKLLKSATSNAEQKGVADIERLFVSELRVDEGPRIKRWMPRAQGRADRRLTRTSHIFLRLSEKTGIKAKKGSTGHGSHAGHSHASHAPAGAKKKAAHKTKTAVKSKGSGDEE